MKMIRKTKTRNKNIDLALLSLFFDAFIVFTMSLVCWMFYLLYKAMKLGMKLGHETGA